jgi:hypothetical protein
VGRAPDHNTAEWSLWLGRPLLGQWSFDLIRLLDALKADGSLPRQVAVVGKGPAGVVALCAAALDERITRVATIDSLASYITEVPYQNQRLGLMAPGILREVGDIATLVSLCAPRRVAFTGGVWGSGEALTAAQRQAAFATASEIWRLAGAAAELKLLDADHAGNLVKVLK